MRTARAILLRTRGPKGFPPPHCKGLPPIPLPLPPSRHPHSPSSPSKPIFPSPSLPPSFLLCCSCSVTSSPLPTFFSSPPPPPLFPLFHLHFPPSFSYFATSHCLLQSSTLAILLFHPPLPSSLIYLSLLPSPLLSPFLLTHNLSPLPPPPLPTPLVPSYSPIPLFFFPAPHHSPLYPHLSVTLPPTSPVHPRQPHTSFLLSSHDTGFTPVHPCPP